MQRHWYERWRQVVRWLTAHKRFLCVQQGETSRQKRDTDLVCVRFESDGALHCACLELRAGAAEAAEAAGKK